MLSWSDLKAQAQRQNRPVEHVAREAMQRNLLASLHDTDFFNHFVFQGGTALVLAYGNPRMSEDLDFVRLRDAPAPPLDGDPVVDEDMLQPALTAASDFAPWRLRPQKGSAFLQRLRLSGTYPDSRHALRINFEFADVPALTQEVHTIDTPLGPALVPVESLAEIYADKVVALAFREYFKGRDIWDIAFLQRRSVTVLWDLVGHKIHDYHQTRPDFVSGLTARLAKLPHSVDLLRTQMKDFVPGPEMDRLDGANAWDQMIHGSIRVVQQALERFSLHEKEDPPNDA